MTANLLPYSVIKEYQNLCFTSGQLPSHDSQDALNSMTFKQQAMSSLDNLGLILTNNNVDWDHVLKINIYVTDLSNYDEFNQLYITYFKKDDIKPARTMIQAASLPKNALIEVEAIFYK